MTARPGTPLEPIKLIIHDPFTGQETVRHAPNPGPVGNGQTLKLTWDEGMSDAFTAEIEPEES